MIRRTEWADYYRIAEMFLDWPMDEEGPCTKERTRINMRIWFADRRSFVYEVAGTVVGCINVKGGEITHAAIHPEDRGKGNFTRMTSALAALMISEGVDELSFEALDQAKFIAEKYNYEGTRNGITGVLHKARVTKEYF